MTSNIANWKHGISKTKHCFSILLDRPWAGSYNLPLVCLSVSQYVCQYVCDGCSGQTNPRNFLVFVQLLRGQLVRKSNEARFSLKIQNWGFLGSFSILLCRRWWRHIIGIYTGKDEMVVRTCFIGQVGTHVCRIVVEIWNTHTHTHTHTHEVWSRFELFC